MTTHHKRGVLSTHALSCSAQGGTSAASPLAEMPGEPASYLSRKQRTLNVFRQAYIRYTDTSFLMNGAFELFLQLYADAFRSCGITLTVIPQVRRELKKKSSDCDAATRQAARRALKLLKHPDYWDLFTYPSLPDLPEQADPAFCRLMLSQKHWYHQILLSEDHGLLSDVCKLCCTRLSEQEYCTHTLSINVEGMVVRRHPQHLSLSPLVELPPCELLAPGINANLLATHASPAFREFVWAPPAGDTRRYFHNALSDSTVYVSRGALEQLFTEGSGGMAFLENIERRRHWDRDLKLHVLNSSLTAELRQQLIPWMHLFHVEAPLCEYLSEEDALLAATCTIPLGSSGRKQHPRRQLLITESTELYRNIMSRAPQSYRRKPVWGVCVAPDGLLHCATALNSYNANAATLAA